MNTHSRNPGLPATTQAAEGLARRRWSVGEIEAMVAQGIIAEDERFELIGGEVVPMSPKGRRHEILREEIEHHLRQRGVTDVRIVAEPQLNLAEDTYAGPDLLLRPAKLRTPDIGGATALLVIEIADSSLAYDLGTKAGLYSAHGVRDYWVINAKTLETRVHRGPGPAGYRDITKVIAQDTLVSLLAPGLAIRLADLDLE